MAQLVSASALGAEGPPFESEYPDKKKHLQEIVDAFLFIVFVFLCSFFFVQFSLLIFIFFSYCVCAFLRSFLHRFLHGFVSRFTSRFVLQLCFTALFYGFVLRLCFSIPRVYL